jgi:NADH-quinone oxidoreductase subunit E
MSVRRLAEAAVQPPAFAFNRANAASARQWIAKYPKGREQSAVIPLLMIAQEQDGWVTKAAIEHVSEMLDMPLIRVLEVATFYTQFQLKPVGTRAHVQVCGTTPCMLRGSAELMDVCRSKIHHEQFHANEAGTLSWEEVECLGACVNAPMVMIFKDTYEDLTPERLGEIIDAFEAGKGASVKPGPQVGRIYSAPVSGLTALKDEKALSKGAGAKPAKAAAPKGDPVPPSKAAKPSTHALETSAAVRSPSPTRVSANGETARSVAAPKVNRREANKAEPAVEGSDKQRTSRKPVSANQAAPLAQTAKAVERKPADANRPAGIKRPAKPDDLKLISGVGPKIEGTLHELGIYTFAQVASWKKAERDWVDGYLNFKGRIDRDDWIRQAKALAKGGVAEYISVFGKKPV